MSGDDIRILRQDIRSLNKKVDDYMRLSREIADAQTKEIKDLQLSEARRQGQESNIISKSVSKNGSIIDGASVVKIILGAFGLVTLALSIAGVLAKALLT